LRKILSNGGRSTPGAPGLNPLLDTSLFYLLVFVSIADISETREEASCSHSQGSEINSQTKLQTQSFDPVSYIGKPLNDTQKKTIIGSKWTPKKGQYSFPITNDRRYNVNWEDKFNWLRYSCSTDSAFCAHCIAFGQNISGIHSDKLCSSGIKDWKNAKRRTFLMHQESKSHKDALLKHQTSCKSCFPGRKKTSSAAFQSPTRIILRKIKKLFSILST
jgi:hypothetical protein